MATANNGFEGISRSLVRALDIGGMIWESSSDYEAVDDALLELEAALGRWMKDNS